MGQSIAAQRLTNQLEAQRAIADAEKNSMGADYIAQLKNTMALESAAWEYQQAIEGEKKQIASRQQADLKGISEHAEQGKKKLQETSDAQLKALQDAQDARIKAAQDGINSLSESVSKLQSFSDSLKSSLEDMRPFSMGEAQSLTDRAIKTRNISNQDDLLRATQTFSGIDTSMYASVTDYERDRQTNATRVEKLKAIADNRLSAAQQQLDNDSLLHGGERIIHP